MEIVIYKPTEKDFIKEVEFNHEEIKKELAARLKKYEGLVYTEETIRDAKSDRANLNKFKDAIENKRKEVKKQCLAPYEAFEAKIKEITAMIDKPILAIDSQVKNYEQIKKDEKKMAVQQFYADKVAGLESLVPFDRIFNERWLNVTYKETDIQKEITDLFIKVENDLAVIDELDTPYKVQIKKTYLKEYDLTAALQEKKAMEEEAAKLAEYKNQQEETKKQALENANLHELTPAPKPVFEAKPKKDKAKVYEIDFRVTGTADQLNALKQFMIDNSIKYIPVPKEEGKAV
jgi:glucan-binding YG repeat protein